MSSTTLASGTSQLYFPGMHCEPPVSKQKSRPGKNAQPGNQPLSGKRTEKAVPKQPAYHEVADTPISAPTLTMEPSNATVPPIVVTSASSNLSLRDGMRVGQVRIGNVMLSLLKKYGITDQEISDVLGAIAQEKCQGLAS